MGIHDDADELREQITKKVEGLIELVRAANEVVSYRCLRCIVYQEDLDFSKSLSEYVRNVIDNLKAERKRRLEGSAGAFLHQLGSRQVDELFRNFEREYENYSNKVNEIRRECGEKEKASQPKI